MKNTTFDIAVIGGSLGGLRAAIGAASMGKRVLLTEETDWVGGQLTSQGVPPDEHWHIESQGATASYREYRRKVREHYRHLPHFSDELKAQEAFDPGASWVSRIAHEPCVAHEILQAELSSYLAEGSVTLLLNTVPVSAVVEEDTILSVTVSHTETGEKTVITAGIFLDGTDTGELLPLVGAEYRCGAESKAETGEAHAPEVACRADMQPVTWVFALELMDELAEKDRMEKPEGYDRYAAMDAAYDDNKIFSWYFIGLNEKKKRTLRMFANEAYPGSLGLWDYRRVVAGQNYKTKVNDISLINWPQQDYVFGNIIEDLDAAFHRKEAKNYARCLAYWIQNDAPRADGGFGYPVRLAGWVLGTADGFAKAPYIRESRRILARQTIREEDCRTETELGRIYENSVGVGLYSMDLHETIVTHTTFNCPIPPFEIPLGALIPVRIRNLLPAAKNIGTTHMTASCYRLHPVEWNIGESAGYLAVFCLKKEISPPQVYESEELTAEFQSLLLEKGIQLHWEL